MILIQRGFSEKEETNLNVLLKYLQSNPLGATLQELKVSLEKNNNIDSIIILLF